MSKSKERKMREIQTRREHPKPNKRDNPDRGKHGCHRLHAMKAEDNREIELINVESSTIPSTKPSLFSTLRTKIRGIING